ncbi:hypothetical protein ACHAXA_002879 [Cyclostephanos tholiformis]|uniref:Tesmin/TSO1-like CXC domain-containing protein n=1 Tax=Cyclostephanos tholiformis TaxID=382380 RepID=A0ABD3RGC0_9STRA
MSNPTREPVGGTSSYGTPPSQNERDERLPPRHGALRPVVATDAASRRQEHTLLMSRTLGVSRSPSAAFATPSGRRNDKRPKISEAREDLCCFCSHVGSCSPRTCSCTKAGRPCRCCNPGDCGRCSNTVEAHNQVICAENRHRSTGIGARFQLRVGRPLDPQIPLYPVDPRPLPMAVDTGFDEGVDQINPSGDATEIDEHAVVFDAFAALPADDDDVAADDDDVMSNASLGPSADATDVESTSTLPGLSAVGIGAPLASVASLGPSAGRGNSPGNADVSGAGPDDVHGAAAHPADDSASGDRPLGLSAERAARPLTSHSWPIDSAVGDAPLAAVSGDNDVPGMGPDVVVVADAAPVCNGTSGDRPLGLSAEGTVLQRASTGSMISSTPGERRRLGGGWPIGLAVRDATSAAVPGDDDVPGMGPDVVVVADAAPVRVGASGDHPLGLSAKRAARPLASHGEPIGSVVGDATSAAVPGDDDVPGTGPDIVIVANAASVCDGTSGDRPLGLSAAGAVCPLASHGGPIGSAVRDATSAAVPGDDNVMGMGPDIVVAADTAPVCDGTSGHRPLGLPAEGAVRPLASRSGPIGSAVGDPTPAAMPGDDDVTGMSRDVVVAAAAAPVCIGASGDCPVGFSAEGRIRPPASAVGPIGSVDGADAPSPVALDISPAADRHRPTEGAVGTANMGMRGEGGELPQRGPQVSSPPAAEAAPPVDADEACGGVDGVAVGNSLDASRAGGTTEGVAQRALGPLPPRPALQTAAPVVALAASTSPAVCTDGCAGGTCRIGRSGTIIPAAILAATAPTVSNPYLNAAGGTAAGMAGVVGGAAGVLDVAPSDAPPAAAGAAAVGNIAPADGDVQGALGLFVPRTFTEEELCEADPRLQRISAANRWLLGVFGDTIHLNDGTHLDGGIGVNEDAKWQRLYNCVASCSLPLYDLPNGRCAHRFLTTLTDLWAGVIQRRWNSERPLVFQGVILRRVRGITRFHDVKPIVWNRLNAWDAGRYVALVKGVEEAYLDSRQRTSLACRYDAMVLGGKVRAAIRMVTDRGAGGPYRPNDLDSKSGRPVIDVLRDKHPACVVPSEEDFDAYHDADDLLDTMPVYCFEDAGPCGVEAEMLKRWLLCHGAHSERLRGVMADWVVWLSNGLPPYAAYRAVNTVWTVALDKCPGVRPLGVGKVWMHLWSDCSHMQTKSAATTACGNTQLCAGLRSGIEANLHASLVREDAGAFDLEVHQKCAKEAGQDARKFRLIDEQLFLDVRGRDNPSVARRDKRNSAAGAWLSVFPNWLNGTDLLADEWRDNVRLRYNHSPLDMPAACDSCGAKMTVEHALSCKMR